MILHINSPGGTIAGSEELYDSLIKLKARKPIVVVVDGLAAFGRLYRGHRFRSHRGVAKRLVGSIGVLFQYPNVSDLLKTIGVKVEEIKSSPLKAAPNGFEPTSPEARAAIEAIVKDSYAWFKGLVRDRRHLDDAALRVADGRVFTGRQALELKLIDALGDEQAAIDWLAKEKNIDPKTPVRELSELTPRFTDLPFLHVAMLGLLDIVGLNGFAERLRRNGARSRRSSDSILTVCWRFGTLRQAIDTGRLFRIAAKRQGR